VGRESGSGRRSGSRCGSSESGVGGGFVGACIVERGSDCYFAIVVHMFIVW
jgi:hypothetical protein